MILSLSTDEQDELIQAILFDLHEHIQFYTDEGRHGNAGVLRMVEGVLRQTLARLAASD